MTRWWRTAEPGSVPASCDCARLRADLLSARADNERLRGSLVSLERYYVEGLDRERADGRRLALRHDEVVDERDRANVRAERAEERADEAERELEALRTAYRAHLRAAAVRQVGTLQQRPLVGAESKRETFWRRQAEQDRRNCVVLEALLARAEGRPC